MAPAASASVFFRPTPCLSCSGPCDDPDTRPIDAVGRGAARAATARTHSPHHDTQQSALDHGGLSLVAPRPRGPGDGSASGPWCRVPGRAAPPPPPRGLSTPPACTTQPLPGIASCSVGQRPISPQWKMLRPPSSTPSIPGTGTSVRVAVVLVAWGASCTYQLATLPTRCYRAPDPQYTQDQASHVHTFAVTWGPLPGEMRCTMHTDAQSSALQGPEAGAHD